MEKQTSKASQKNPILKKSNEGKLALSDIKIWYEATLIKTT